MLSWIKLTAFITLLSVTLTFHFMSVAKHKALKDQEATIALQEAQKKALEVQGELLIKAMQIEQEKNEQIQKLTATAESLRISLQQRPSRTTYEVIHTETQTPCTGRELFKEDGEFLVREAARADRAVAERDYYYNQYEQVRKKLDEWNSTN